MNATYCHGRKELSSRDSAGLAYVYPGPTADRLAVPFSFPFAGGVVTGADSNAPIEFAQRVAGVWAFHYGAATWQRTSPSGWEAIAYNSSSVPLAAAMAGASQAGFRALFTDEWVRPRTGPMLTIRLDAGHATAVLLSAL